MEIGRSNMVGTKTIDNDSPVEKKDSQSRTAKEVSAVVPLSKLYGLLKQDRIETEKTLYETEQLRQSQGYAFRI